ncbi:hypothetical protein DLREEDagr8_39160 [Dongia sp. agr-C8]
MLRDCRQNDSTGAAIPAEKRNAQPETSGRAWQPRGAKASVGRGRRRYRRDSAGLVGAVVAGIVTSRIIRAGRIRGIAVTAVVSGVMRRTRPAATVRIMAIAVVAAGVMPAAVVTAVMITAVVAAAAVMVTALGQGRAGDREGRQRTRRNGQAQGGERSATEAAER